MRVLHVHRISGIGGSERHLLVLLPARLVGSRHEVKIHLSKGVKRSVVGSLDLP